MTPRFKALYRGPNSILDCHQYNPPGGTPCSHTWGTTGLYAIDLEDRPWALCWHTQGHLKWLLMDDFIRGPQ